MQKDRAQRGIPYISLRTDDVAKLCSEAASLGAMATQQRFNLKHAVSLSLIEKEGGSIFIM